MTILMTGGAGFIGQYVARQLTSRGFTVLAIDSMLSQVHADPKGEADRFPGDVIRSDISEFGTWNELPDVDGIIHLAAETGTGQSMYETDRYMRVNVEGTRCAAKFAKSRAVPLVFVSSRAVYGEGRYENTHGKVLFQRTDDPEFFPVDSLESDPHNPVSVYGETKSKAEAVIVGELEGESPFAIIRPQNVIGYGQALHNPYTGVLAAFLARLREGRNLTVYGDGTATRDFIHVDDVAAIIAFALEQGLEGKSLVVNAGSGERISLTQLAEFAIAGSPGPKVSIDYVDVHRAGDIEHAAASLAHLREIGGPIPRWKPKDAVADFISKSWNDEGVASDLWDRALAELADKGLVS